MRLISFHNGKESAINTNIIKQSNRLEESAFLCDIISTVSVDRVYVLALARTMCMS
jgi:hypothetical protein